MQQYHSNLSILLPPFFQSPRGVPLLKMVEVLFVGGKFSELMPLRELKRLKNNSNMEFLQYFLWAFYSMESKKEATVTAIKLAPSLQIKL